MKFLKRNKRGDLELDEIGKMILALIALIILIVIVTVYIQGSLDDNAGRVGDAFNAFD